MPNKDDDIQTLLKKEKNQSALHGDQSLFKNKKMQKLNDKDTDEQFDCVNNQMFEQQTNTKKSARKRKRDEQREENAKHHKKARLISQYKQATQWLQSCQYCVENEDHFISHLVIFRGEFMYIAVPKQECLVDYECVIVPNLHLKSFREGLTFNEQIGASKDEQSRFDKELYAMQKILCKLFKTECGCGCVFVETVRNLKKNYHSVIHVYPVPFEQFNICPIIFKKSIMESDVMWTTNKRIIDITKQKPLSKAIPHFMSYFFVQFGLYDGYVHVIEDETKVRQDFGAAIIAGLVEKVLFKRKNEAYAKQLERVNAFKKLFGPYKEMLESKLHKNGIKL